ncbi:hypothetical protein [Lysinibacillus xylanilyticus]|uniref:hypothetical protein n=1 Tax=Lysinibacillus xylanilyticus TaxID=582475 RepID=UPI003D0861AE
MLRKFFRSDDSVAYFFTILLFFIVVLVALTTVYFENIVKSFVLLLDLTQTDMMFGLTVFLVLTVLLLISTVLLINISWKFKRESEVKELKKRVTIIHSFTLQFGIFMFVLGEVLLYFLILMMAFVFFVDKLNYSVSNQAIILFVVSILISVLITVGAYYLITSFLVWVIIRIRNELSIPLSVVKKAGATHKAFGAIFFITSLGSGLVIGVFAPNYTLSDTEKVLVFSLTVACAMNYIITDIINGYLGLNLIKKLHEKNNNQKIDSKLIPDD